MTNVVEHIDRLLRLSGYEIIDEASKKKSSFKKKVNKFSKALKATAGTALTLAGVASIVAMPDPELGNLLGASSTAVGAYIAGKALKKKNPKIKSKGKEPNERFKYVKTKHTPNKFWPDDL